MDKKTNKKKEDNPIVNVTSGSFPLNLFVEWDKDCKENFGNCRWMKMWHDHNSSKRMDMFAKLFDEIKEIKQQLAESKKEPEQEPVTLSGEKVE